MDGIPLCMCKGAKTAANITGVSEEKKMSIVKQERHSGIELLKIIAIVMIVFCHASPTRTPEYLFGPDGLPPYIMQLGYATDSIQRFIIVLFYYGGSVGNAIFLTCSAWFLLESKGLNIKKVLYIVADFFVISVIFLAVFLAGGYSLPIGTVISQFFPITTASNWFITCYVLFYLTHPLLNLIIKNLNQRTLLCVDLVIIILYSGIQVLLPDSLYYSKLIGFICVYFVIAYVKTYLCNAQRSLKANAIILLSSSVCLIALIGMTNYLGLKTQFFSDQVIGWGQFMNPLILLIALSSFLLIKNLKFHSKTINYVAGLSMLIYIIHRNELVANYLETDAFKFIYETFTYKYELAWVVLCAICLLVGATVLGVVYRETLQKAVHKIADWLYKVLTPPCNRVVGWLMKFD